MESWRAKKRGGKNNLGGRVGVALFATTCLVGWGALSPWACKRRPTSEQQTVPEAHSPFAWPRGKVAAVSLSFDDGYPGQLERGLPILQKYDVRATFFPLPQSIHKYASQWERAVLSGQEVGNHSFSHPCTGNHPGTIMPLELVSIDDLRTDFQKASEFTRQTIGIKPTSFAYPCGQKFIGRGQRARSYIPLVAELFQVGRGWDDEAANVPALVDLAQVLAVKLDGASPAEAVGRIERAVQRGGWLVFASHQVGESGGPLTTSEATLAAVCSYATDPANGIWVDTIQAIGRFVAENQAVF